ncbi:MAG: tetratricopeptide repeat protein [Pseudomonadota bacterium]
MGPKRLGLTAALGVACLGACTSLPSASKPYFASPMFSKPPEADAFSAVLIARYAALNNDPAEAVAQYAAVIDDLPDGDAIAVRGVFAALMSGDFDQAVRFARKATAGSADGPGGSSLSDLTLAVHAISKGRQIDPDTQLRPGRFGPFNRAMAINMAAWVAFERDGLAAAEAVLDGAETDGFAVHTVTLAMAGLMQASAGETARALATFERIDTIGPRLAMSTGAQARILAATGKPEKARERLAAFRTEVGINPELTALDRAIAEGAEISLPRLTLAEGAALGIYAPAAALAARSDSDLPGVYFALALALDPTLDVARTLWADRLDQANRRAEAIAMLRPVSERSPFYAAAQAQIAWAQRREGDGEAALETVRAALASTGDRDLKVQFGDLLMSLGQDSEAEAVLTELIDSDARAGRQTWQLYFARGIVRERLANWTGAEPDLTQALALAPDNADIMNQLGYGWADRQRNLDTAIPMLERAAALKPHAGHIIDSLGWAYFQAGRYDEAVAQLEQSVALDPTSIVANDHLGDAYWQQGRRLEATFQWERALSLDPAKGQAARLRRKLTAGLPPGTGGLVGTSIATQDALLVQP